MSLILASGSRYRRALLARLGLPFRAVSPRFTEQRPGSDCDPEPLVLANALGKARSLAADYPGSVIIGSDQVAECSGEILTKPGSAQRAVAQLLHLAGREHRLLTALAVLRSPLPKDAPHPVRSAAWQATRIVVSRLRIRPLTSREAQAYVTRERPLDCAGAYKSEGLGITLFEYLRGDDPTAIIGLPLVALSDLLRQAGIDPLTAADRPGSGAARPREEDSG